MKARLGDQWRHCVDAAHQIPAPRSVIITGKQVDAAGALDFPVAVKALSPELLHETKLGAVVLDIQ